MSHLVRAQIDPNDPALEAAYVPIGKSGILLTGTPVTGLASDAPSWINWQRTGTYQPVGYGSDVTLSVADPKVLRFNTDGIYAVTCFLGSNANDGSNCGPIEYLALKTYVTGSRSALSLNGLSPYVGGMWQGAVTSAAFTLDFKAGDSLYFLGAAGTPSRAETVTTTSGSPVVSDANIQAHDLWKPVTGTGIPTNTYVGSVTPGVSFTLSSTKNTATAVNATASGTVLATIGGAKWNLEGQGGTYCAVYRVAPTPSTLPPAATAPTLVRQNAKSSLSATSQTITLPSVTAGHGLVLTVSAYPQQTLSVTDSAGGTWTKAAGVGTAGIGEADVWYCPASPGSAGTLTATVAVGGGGANVAMNLSEWSTPLTADAPTTISQTAGVTAATVPVDTLPNELAITVLCCASNATPAPVAPAAALTATGNANTAQSSIYQVASGNSVTLNYAAMTSTSFLAAGVSFRGQ